MCNLQTVYHTKPAIKTNIQTRFLGFDSRKFIVRHLLPRMAHVFFFEPNLIPAKSIKTINQTIKNKIENIACLQN